MKSHLSRKSLTNAYTFKLKKEIPAKKPSDPVFLFQTRSELWKKDKFLKKTGQIQEGRKLPVSIIKNISGRSQSALKSRHYSSEYY